jgi:1-deoxyxylulose-5-phosphate synthase
MRLLKAIDLSWNGSPKSQKSRGFRAHIALAWLLQKEPVTALIIGATKISHLEDVIGALSVKLTSEEIAYLEEPYVPHRIVGHQ